MTHVRMTHMFFLLNLGHAWMNKAKFYQLIFVLVYLNKRLIGELTLNQSFNFFLSKPKLQLLPPSQIIRHLTFFTPSLTIRLIQKI
jgi:hypothetical protein